MVRPKSTKLFPEIGNARNNSFRRNEYYGYAGRMQCKVRYGPKTVIYARGLLLPVKVAVNNMQLILVNHSISPRINHSLHVAIQIIISGEFIVIFRLTDIIGTDRRMPGPKAPPNCIGSVIDHLPRTDKHR